MSTRSQLPRSRRLAQCPSFQDSWSLSPGRQVPHLLWHQIGRPCITEHRCLCGTTLDSYGTHALVCQRINSMFTRHTITNEDIRDAFKTAQTPVTLEPTGLLRDDGRRPYGTISTPWHRGKLIAWDFTCVNRLATSNISSGQKEGPVIANIAEDRKCNNYRQLETSHHFEPVAIETLGGIGV